MDIHYAEGGILHYNLELNQTGKQKKGHLTMMAKN